jgi:hypothetical protein
MRTREELERFYLAQPAGAVPVGDAIQAVSR